MTNQETAEQKRSREKAEREQRELEAQKTKAAEEKPEPAVVEEVDLGTFEIVSEEFFPFTEGSLEGLSIVAQISDGEHDTEYSVSFIRGLDNDWTPTNFKPIPGANADGIEDDDALKQRLREAVLAEANDPRRALLMKSRFTS